MQPEITTVVLDDETVVVAVDGEVTFSNAGGLRRALEAVSARRLVIDLTAVAFIDSSGLSELLTASARMRERGGALAVVIAADEPPAIFRFRGVERLLALYPSRDAALDALS